MRPRWLPLNPVRWIERSVDGKVTRVLQQAWAEHTLRQGVRGNSWVQTQVYEWRDVPVMPDEIGDPAYWSQEKPIEPKAPRALKEAVEVAISSAAHKDGNDG